MTIVKGRQAKKEEVPPAPAERVRFSRETKLSRRFVLPVQARLNHTWSHCRKDADAIRWKDDDDIDMSLQKTFQGQQKKDDDHVEVDWFIGQTPLQHGAQDFWNWRRFRMEWDERIHPEQETAAFLAVQAPDTARGGEVGGRWSSWHDLGFHQKIFSAGCVLGTNDQVKFTQIFELVITQF